MCVYMFMCMYMYVGIHGHQDYRSVLGVSSLKKKKRKGESLKIYLFLCV